jgi:acetolactate synthase I/II/III large subunit
MLPSDMLLEEGPAPRRSISLGEFPLDRALPPMRVLDQAAEMVVSAARPIVIAGGGIHLSRAHEQLARLQEKAHLPVATTNMGKGAVSDLHPLTVGVVGAAMGINSPTRHLRHMITDADLVILVGNRTNQNGTDSYSLYPDKAKYIHIDIDGTEIGRNYEALRLQGDARETLDELLKTIETKNLDVRAKSRSDIEDQISKGKAAYKTEAHSVLQSQRSPIRPERVMTELDKVLKPDDIVVADASYSSVWVVNYLTARAPGQRFLTPRGMAGLGWGLPMAMGAKVAKPGSNVFCLAGDGGFGHVWSELETCRRMNIKVVLFVLNNSILGFSKHADNVRFGTHSTAVNLGRVDHCAIAKGAGCEAIHVTDPAQLPTAIAAATASKITTLIEIDCDDQAFPPFTNYSELDLQA